MLPPYFEKMAGLNEPKPLEVSAWRPRYSLLIATFSSLFPFHYSVYGYGL